MDHDAHEVTVNTESYKDGYHDGYIDALREMVNGDILDPVAHLAEMLGEGEEE